MFKQRLLTALVLIPLVLFALFYANDWVLLIILSCLVMGLAWEWTALIPLRLRSTKTVFVVMTLPLSWLMLFVWHDAVRIDGFLWLGIIMAIRTYPQTVLWWGRSWVVAMVAWFVVALFGSSFWALYHSNQGHTLVLYALCLVWAADIGAYVAGKQYGRHRLIPHVSPGKTIEGALGGILFAMMVSALAARYFHPRTLGLWFAQALLLTIVSMFGDLFISMLKRRCNVKDTGHILPGHGGILDRLDSFIAILPFFYYFYPTFLT